MEVKLDNLNFQEVFSAAILQSLDNGKKEELIKGAIQSLMTKNGNSYSSKTPLQEAFERALYERAKDYIASYIDTDPTVKKAILDLINDAVVKITTDAREKTVGKIAEKIIEGLYSDKY